MHDADAAAFYQHLETIPGFLFPVAAHGTAWLLEAQTGRGTRGGLVEIGVFRGKYFAVLARAAQASGEPLLGIDNFVYSPEAAVHEALASSPVTARARVRVLARSSRDVTGDEILAMLGGRARFVSVDGSHEADDVHHDLVLADGILAREGVVAVDDFLNPRALGVGEATYRFLRDADDLVPFALFGNKLFVCRPDAKEEYAGLARGFFRGTGLPEGDAFRHLDRLGPEHVEQRIYGQSLLVM